MWTSYFKTASEKKQLLQSNLKREKKALIEQAFARNQPEPQFFPGIGTLAHFGIFQFSLGLNDIRLCNRSSWSAALLILSSKRL